MKTIRDNVFESITRSDTCSPPSRHLREKLLLGLTLKEYGGLVLKNPVNWVLCIILAIGLPLLAQRYVYGLQAITHESQDYPWGVVLGFGLFAMVPLSASGFLLSTTVEIFQRDDFHPI